jgi:hypothetical protein
MVGDDLLRMAGQLSKTSWLRNLERANGAEMPGPVLARRQLGGEIFLLTFPLIELVGDFSESQPGSQTFLFELSPVFC